MPKETSKSGRGRRRSSIRVERAGVGVVVRRLAQSPQFGWAVVVTVAFALVCGIIAGWSREQPLVAAGRVMTETRTVRVPFSIFDQEATEETRERARQAAPRVYVAELSVLDEIRTSLENLPRTLAGVETLDQVDRGIREQFRLTQQTLEAVRGQFADGKVKPQWLAAVSWLDDWLKRRPMLDGQSWQQASQERGRELRLVVGEATPQISTTHSLYSIAEAEQLAKKAREWAEMAGFPPETIPVVAARLTVTPRPTFRYDAAATGDLMNRAASQVQDVVREYLPGHTIFRRGDVLTPAALDLYRQELRHFKASADRMSLWLPRLGVLGLAAVIALAMAAYVATFCARIRRNPTRMWALGVLMALALALACVLTVSAPWAVGLSVVGPTLFVAVILVVAYDQRVALALAVLHGLLVCIALKQPVGMFALIMIGVGTAVWQLREVRDRRSIVSASVVTAVVLLAGGVIVGLVDHPIKSQSLREVLLDGLWAGGGALGVGMTILFLLPSIERLFDITTGMTLIELRDPKQPLLRELQQRAPGTYNHSLNVASIAEAAANAIGADSLLTYVGALYHDIGKMNKPDYFVENQTPGFNRHDKLSPAMSLLVIVGHVKDGMEMAHAEKLPRALHHFIEAHHGTTLVEFFYHRARKKAEEGGDEDAAPEEIEYRYPGPKPRTKEAAILMLADTVESATRSVSEPTPSRIEALVESIADKRLLDGQFDECEMTLKELHTIVGSISKTVASIYHGRIAYPSGEKRA